MSLPVFPVLPGLGYTVVKAPSFKTLVTAGSNEYEMRLSQMTNPVWEFTLIYEFLRDYPWGSFVSVSELRTMMGFFNQVNGQAGSFLFTDPDDNYVGPALVSGSPNSPLAELSVVTDGAGNYYSPVQRTLDGVFYEDVTDLNGAITVYQGTTLCTQTTGAPTAADQFQLLGPGLALPTSSYMGMYLYWGSFEPSALVVAQFNFYYRMRFASDSADFEKFLNAGSAAANYAGQGGGLWTVGGTEAQNGNGFLKIRTARPTPV